jgi:serine protease
MEHRQPDPSRQTSGWRRTAIVSLWLVLSTFVADCAVLSPPSGRRITFTVDPSLRPTQAALPGLDGVTSRPLARLVEPRGHPVDFVYNELVLVTDEPTILSAFIVRWNGILPGSLVPADYGLKGVSQHLIRIDPNRANAGTLSADLEVLAPRVGRGAHRVSSQEGLNLLAAAAREAVEGSNVGVNWVGHPADFVSRTTSESPSGPSAGLIPSCCPNEFGIGGYSPNAYDWNYLNQETWVDIGVTEAWRLLALAGKLGNKVDLAILDQGFLPNTDFPPGGTAWSVGAFDPIGTIGWDDPWHGTKVVGAAMAVTDNKFGAAGPGGPVARPILIYTSYDPWSSSIALMNAVAFGAKIVNMSYHWSIPAMLSFTVLPFEFTTAIVRGTGILLFASAGNDGDDVDAEDCFIVCWEEEWVTPCENSGVICVGGLDIGSV